MRVLSTIRSRVALRMMAITVLTSVALAGCVGGCIQIPPIEFEVNLMKNQEVPGLGPLAWLATTTDREIKLPDACDLPGLADYRQEVMATAGEFLTGLISIDGLDLRKTVFTASEGDFNNLTKVQMMIQAGNFEYDLGTAESHGGLGTGFELVPPQTTDLLEILESRDCIEMKIYVSGTAPAKKLVFDIDATLQVRASVGL